MITVTFNVSLSLLSHSLMDKIRERIVEEFGNKLRVRVCGICIENGKILLVNHQSLNQGGDFWGPPGGGMDFGLSAEENLKREFLEETGLIIKVDKFLFVHEYLNPPLHAIELIFKVVRIGGKVKIGMDPEMKVHEQIIKNVSFLSFNEINKLEKGGIHQLFQNVSCIEDIEELKEYYIYKNEFYK